MPALVSRARALGALVLLSVLHASVAAAVDPRDAVSPDEDAPPPPPRRVGLMFDVGSIEGGLMSLVYRPTSYLRLEAGAGTNSISPGFRLGVVALPFGSAASLSLSGGHFFEGDLNGIARAFSSGGYTHSARLEHFDYDFASLHLGWETESAGIRFFAQGGASVLWTELPALRNASPSAAASSGTQPYWLVLPSLRLGFIGFL